jgi:hypothetical protein
MSALDRIAKRVAIEERADVVDAQIEVSRTRGDFDNLRIRAQRSSRVSRQHFQREAGQSRSCVSA